MKAHNAVLSLTLAAGLCALPSLAQAAPASSTCRWRLRRNESMSSRAARRLSVRAWLLVVGQRPLRVERRRFIEDREGHRYIEHRWEHDGDDYHSYGGHWDDD